MKSVTVTDEATFVEVIAGKVTLASAVGVLIDLYRKLLKQFRHGFNYSSK